MSSVDILNNYLQGQQPKQRNMIYIAIAIIVLGLGYSFYIDETLVELSDKQEQLEQKETKLKQIKINSTLSKIKQLNKSIAKLKGDISQRKTGLEVNGSSENDNSLFSINDSTFALYLKNSLAKSNQLHVNLLKVDIFSDKIPYIGILEIKKRIQIDGYGRFLNVLKFIRFMENQNFLIKVKDLKIEKPIKEKESKTDEKDMKLDIKDVRFNVMFEVLGAAL